MANCVNGKSAKKITEDSSSFKNTDSSESEDVVSSSQGVKRPAEDDPSAHYPKELKEMFGPLKCDLCSISANATLAMFTHYKGKAHQKKINKYLKDNDIKIDNPNKKAKEEFAVSTCEVCNVTLTSEIQSLQHFSGKSHKKKVANSGETAKVKVASEAYDPSGRFGIGKAFHAPTPEETEEEEAKVTKSSNESVHFCSVCSVFTTSTESLSAHMLGSKHRKKIAMEQSVEFNSLSKFRTPSDYYYCPVCNISANSAEQFLFHMQSKKHTSNKKKEST